jgi:hypothetical protein
MCGTTSSQKQGLLQPLSRRNQEQHISLYANDIAPFIQPMELEINLTMDILDKFGEASGLHTNLQNKSCHPNKI